MPKKLSLYKSVKTERGWRYCKAAFHRFDGMSLAGKS
jgi:hypothetical protein